MSLRLVDYLRQAASEAEPPRADALRALTEHIETAPLRGPASRLRDDDLLLDVPAIRGLVEGYGHSGPGAETSFVEAATTMIRSRGVEQFAARPRWAMINFWTYALALFREQRIRCPECNERIRREAAVCRYCGYRLDQIGGSDRPAS